MLCWLNTYVCANTLSPFPPFNQRLDGNRNGLTACDGVCPKLDCHLATPVLMSKVKTIAGRWV